VVDGLCSPPAILRPGGVSVEQLRECEGWGDVRITYADKAEDKTAPRAPGMKYRHYSPKARVVLYEAGRNVPSWDEIKQDNNSIGFILTKRWKQSALFKSSLSYRDSETRHVNGASGVNGVNGTNDGRQADCQSTNGELQTYFSSLLLNLAPVPTAHAMLLSDASTGQTQSAWIVDLGTDTKDVARGFFSALRELDRKEVGTIFVEGLDEDEGDVAVAVMNRLRKAAEVNLS